MAGIPRPFRRPPLGAAVIALSLVVSSVAMPFGAQAATARSFTFRGRAWGHGLGVSQWGARGLAVKGWTADRILAHYYRGTKLETKTPPSLIRVGIFQDQSDTRVVGTGPIDFYDNGGTRRATTAAGQSWRIVPVVSDRVGVYRPDGSHAFTSVTSVIMRYEPRGTRVDVSRTGRTYARGRIDFEINGASRKLRGVLWIPFEKYLHGVAEMSSSWPTEALKTQAIAARTYAQEKVSRLGQNRPGCNCGVYATTSDQVYAGYTQEVPNWVAAVNATKSRVVTYGGKPIQAMYSSSSGGYTENSETWGGSAFPYLRGVCDPGDYNADANPHSNWSVTIDGADLDGRMKRRGFDVGAVQKIQVLSPRGVSGRVGRVIDANRGGVQVTGSAGTARLSGETFRSITGLKSTLIFHRIGGAIRIRYDQLNCGPALPTGEEFTWRNLGGTDRGRAQNFAKGRLFWNRATNKVFWTRTAILARYDELRRGGTDLGLPISDEYIVSGGRRSDFERGSITWDSASGKTTVRFTG